MQSVYRPGEDQGLETLPYYPDGEQGVETLPYQPGSDSKSLDFLKSFIAGAGPSFEIEPPDIDSPTVDKWIEQYRNQPGYKPPGPSLPQLRRNINRLRSTLKPV